MLRTSVLTAILCSALALSVAAKTNDSTQPTNPPQDTTQQQNPVPSEQNNDVQITPMSKTPVYRVNVTERTAHAVDYRHRAGSTKIDFRGTEVQPQITGEAKVDSKSGRLQIDASLEHMKPASTFGPQYLTYVLWAITPAGRPVNLGEVLPNDDAKAKLQVTTNLQAFGMIVTAEPYFAVTRPSDMVVAENYVQYKTKGWEQPIEAKFEALNRNEYTVDLSPAQLPATTADRKKVPLELLEARNAVAIAKAAGADKYASDTLQRAEDFLAKGEDYLNRHQSKSAIGTVARYAAQQAEDARVLTIRRRNEEKVAQERQRLQENAQQAQQQAQEDAARAAAARENAQMEAERRAEAEQQTQQAEQARMQAQQEAQQAAQERAAAEQARQQALQAQQQLQSQVQQARLQAQQAEQEKEQARARLTQQLNQVLQTRDTAKGLIVNMSDVLFDFNKASLKPGARERLAKVAGIILAYPDLKLQIAGFTDNVGSEGYNLNLSEKRAVTVRDFLVSQGVNAANVTARGMGESDPVASNSTSAGRQMNRRVELVVSGQSIEAQGRTTRPAGTPGTAATGTVTGSSTTETNSSRTVETNSGSNTTVPASPTQPMNSQSQQPGMAPAAVQPNTDGQQNATPTATEPMPQPPSRPMNTQPQSQPAPATPQPVPPPPPGTLPPQ